MSLVKIYQGYSKEITEEISVVIDVLRAFSTSYYLFSSGVNKITMSQNSELLKRLACDDQGVLVGEKNGIMIEGFNLGNSPDEILNAQMKNKNVYFCTSNGVRGVFHCCHSKDVYVTGLIGVKNIIQKLRTEMELGRTIALLASHPSSDDDLAIAEYIQSEILEQREISIDDVKRRIIESESAHKFNDESNVYFKKRDLDYCLEAASTEVGGTVKGFLMKASFNSEELADLVIVK